MKVAVTGHQNLGDNKTLNWIETQLEFTIKQINIDEGYCCLAIGADQLFAEIILRNKIPLIVIIPSHNYQNTFDNFHINNYKLLLNSASKKIQLEYNNPTETAFFEASKLMLTHCDLLIAIWNKHHPAKGFGGTADVVKYAKEIKKKIIHIDPLTKTIKN